MGNKGMWLSKDRGGCIFESCDISLENMPTSHAVSLALLMYPCSDFAMPLLLCTCLCNNSSCLVSPSPLQVLLLRCFFLNIRNNMHGGINMYIYVPIPRLPHMYIQVVVLSREVIICNNFIQKRGWAYFELRYIYIHFTCFLDS